MPTVETVAGPVDAAELGLTLVHEHFRFSDEALRFQFPRMYDEAAEWEAAVADAQAVAGHGVRTVVDPNAMFGGRDAGFSRRVAEASGLNVVLGTGIYTYDHLPVGLLTRSAEQIADLYVADIEEGMQGTDVKAAFIKCAADVPGMTENVEKLHRAVAQASLRTGRPIMAHSHPASGTGLEQMRVFEEEGVDPRKVQIAHTGDTDDLDYIERLLERGPWIGMDRYGLDLYLPADRRNATVLALLERGYADRMMLSQDYCSTIDWFPPELAEQLKATEAAEWSMTFLFDHAIPALREGGMTDAQLDTMMVSNPRSWLT